MKKALLTFVTASVALGLQAQFTNGGFESWHTITLGSASIEEPIGYKTTNYLFALSNKKPVVKSNDRASGSYSLQLKNTRISIGGKDSLVTGAVAGKFSVPGAPVLLNGKFMATLLGTTDTAYITVLATKWNPSKKTTDFVSGTFFEITESTNGFQSFSAEFEGFSGVTPDSVFIVMSAGGDSPDNTTEGSSIWVDDLSFSYDALAINNEVSEATAVRMFPSPATEQVSFSNLPAGASRYRIISSQGQQVVEGVVEHRSEVTVFLNRVAKGFYLVEILDAEGAVVYKNKLLVK